MSEPALFSSLEGQLKPEPRGQLTELALTLTHCAIRSKSQLCLRRAGRRYPRLWKWGWHGTAAACASCAAEAPEGANAAIQLLCIVQTHRLARRSAQETPYGVTP